MPVIAEREITEYLMNAVKRKRVCFCQTLYLMF